MGDIQREEWESEVFENLEYMSANSMPMAAIHTPDLEAECARCTDDAELAQALKAAPLLDEEQCCSRLA